MKEYTDQFDEFEYWDFNDELYCLDCYGNADKDFLKDALECNLAVIFANIRQDIVLREDYFKLAMSHLFFLRERMKHAGLGCHLFKEMHELMPKEPIPLS